MSTFTIYSKAGLDFGTYEGETAEAAFRAMVAEGIDGTDVDGRSTAGTIDDWIVAEVHADAAQMIV